MASVNFNIQPYPDGTRQHAPFSDVVHVVASVSHIPGELDSLDVEIELITYSKHQARATALSISEASRAAPDGARTVTPYIWLYMPDDDAAVRAARDESYERRGAAAGEYHCVVTMAVQPESRAIGAKLVTLSRSGQYANEIVAGVPLAGEEVINGLRWLTQTIILTKQQ